MGSRLAVATFTLNMNWASTAVDGTVAHHRDTNHPCLDGLNSGGLLRIAALRSHDRRRRHGGLPDHGRIAGR